MLTMKLQSHLRSGVGGNCFIVPAADPIVANSDFDDLGASILDRESGFSSPDVCPEKKRGTRHQHGNYDGEPDLRRSCHALVSAKGPLLGGLEARNGETAG